MRRAVDMVIVIDTSLNLCAEMPLLMSEVEHSIPLHVFIIWRDLDRRQLHTFFEFRSFICLLFDYGLNRYLIFIRF